LREPGSLVMPFDGYHYAMRDLKNFSNPDDAIYRRGAPDTFDVDALKRDLQRIRYGSEATILLPGFDHSVGDPEDDAHIFVREGHRIVITEGLYLLHEEQGWKDVRDYFDYSVFVDADIDVSMARLKERNKVIPGYTVEEIEVRVDAVDRINALTVVETKNRANLVVKSAALAKYKKKEIP
jgi:pantothenate kinase